MVARTSHQMEWAQSPLKEARHDHRDRCLNHRLGSIMSGKKDRGTLVPRGKTKAYKLLGVASSSIGSEVLCQGQGKHPDPSQDGQHYSPHLYINKLEGTASQELNHLTKDLWTWCLSRNISLQATHLAGIRNITADEESRVMKDRSDWMLCPDLFASRLIHQLRDFVSWRPDPEAMATDAFTLDWKQFRGYANPPWSLVGRVLSQVREQKAQLVLVAPVLKSQIWYPTHGNPGTPSVTSQSRIDPADPQGQQTGHQSNNSHMDYLRQRFRTQNLSAGTSRLLLSSWRKKTAKSYESLFNKWVRWCNERNSDPVLGEVINFLAALYDEGYQYRSLNAYRSAISSVHEKIDGYDVGQHPMVTRLIKGAFQGRPPQPRHTETWNVATVTTYLESLGDNEKMSLNDLSYKTVMLMALTRPSRSADIANLSLGHRKYSPEGVSFQPTQLAKQSRPSKAITEFFFPSFSGNPLLCPVTTLRAYEDRTKERRGDDNRFNLFIALIRPYRPVSSSTIARWIKSTLTKSRINTDIFKAHSVRSAAVSSAANAGVTISEIISAADWSNETVFQKFYYKLINRKQKITSGVQYYIYAANHYIKGYKITLI